LEMIKEEDLGFEPMLSELGANQDNGEKKGV
jgi:hypothetical protein